MAIAAEQVLCRFHLVTTLRHGMQPFYVWLVEVARRSGMQGATVLKGCFGLRGDGTILEEHSWKLVQDLPVIVEMVDSVPKITEFLARVEPEIPDGTVTLERARVLVYRGGADDASAMATGAGVPVAAHEPPAQEVRTMKMAEPGALLRIFIGDRDREPDSDRPLYEGIVRRAREAGLAGATVLRGPMGFGRHSLVHTARLLEMSTDLPVVIEIVDRQDRIERFLPQVEQLVTEGLVTIESVRVLRYGTARESR